MSQPESRLQRRIRDALERDVGGFWYKVHGSPYQPSGLPDLHGTVRGLSCWVEVKMPGGEVSAVQRARMVELMDAGGLVCVATTPAEACDTVRELLARPNYRFCFGCLRPQPHYQYNPTSDRLRCGACDRADR